MTQMKAANPRKISFLDNICDSCGVADSSCKLSVLDTDKTSSSVPDTGWIIYGNAECQRSMRNGKLPQRSHADEERYGENFYIQRSTGELQSEWNYCNAFRAAGDEGCWW